MRGRLSVQLVEEGAWNAIVALAKEGGWEEMDLKVKKGTKAVKSTSAPLKAKVTRKTGTRKAQDEVDTPADEGDNDNDSSSADEMKTKRGTKRKSQVDEDADYSAAPRRTRRQKR
ncbi:hypothetical protein H0H87_011102 [Tephrocybe sp. NHM501043]|nr:hypothetical protein H0H87_011102 [Tephrocybe sp. NHM501043]